MESQAHNRQWAGRYPDLGTGPLSTEPYISEERFAREKERIFGRTWLNVGRIEDLPETGGCFARDIQVSGASVLIVRGPDGKVRGFHNVCSHRGTRMVPDDGRARRGTKILCPYHHWLYGAAGDLIHIPDEEDFFDLDKTCHGLSPVHTDVRQGFIFVNMAADPPETLADYLGEIMEPLDGCPFDELKRTFTYRVEVNANWKLLFDGQNEFYHLPILHRHIMGRDFVTNAQGHHRYRNLRLYACHSFSAVDFPSYRTVTPLRMALASDLYETPEFRVPGMTGDMDQYTLFPNLTIEIVRLARTTVCVTYAVWPMEVGRTLWEVRFHFKEPASVRDHLRQQSFRRVSLDILQEDVFAAESVYAGMASRGKSHMILKDSEIILRHRQKVVEDFIGGPQ
ncbi:MAG: aromatic ring-hydroxylating dioxygenase subunit alpha [Gammaproteobacteria bacterium]|nr:aromatic ring-hydroxylating dioxygenase subunit alpha [Gammaproteobacteria bacterium]